MNSTTRQKAVLNAAQISNISLDIHDCEKYV